MQLHKSSLRRNPWPIHVSIDHEAFLFSLNNDRDSLIHQIKEEHILVFLVVVDNLCGLLCNVNVPGFKLD